MTRTACLLLPVVLAVPAIAWSDADRNRAPQRPDLAQQRQEQEIADLIRRLSSEDPKEQEAATVRLFTIGKPAVEPLRKLGKWPDTPAKLRAKELAEEIHERTWGALNVETAQFFPDGKKVAFVSSMTYRSHVIVREIRTERDLMCLRGTPPRIGRLDVSPDGRYLVVPGWVRPGRFENSADYWIGIWDWQAGKLAKRLVGHTNGIGRAWFTRDGKTIVSASLDGTIRFWDIETEKEIARIDAHDGWVCDLRLSPDGKQMLSCGKDNTIKLWDVTTRKELARFLARSRPSQIAYSADGQWAACIESGKGMKQQPNRQWVNSDAGILVIDMQARKIHKRIDYTRAYVQSVAIENGGKRVLLGDSYDRLMLWDVEKGQELGHVLGRNNIHGTTFMNSGKEAWAMDMLGNILQWELPR